MCGYIVTDKNVQSRIVSDSCKQEFILSAPVIIVVCADINRSESRYGERGGNLYCIQDTGAAIQNILLCAKDIGLGTCWCGAFNEEALSEILQLQKDIQPVALIPVGYPANEPVPTKRRPLDEIVTFIGDNDKYSGVQNNEDDKRLIEHCDMSGTLFNDVNLGACTFSNINLCEVEITDANLANGKIHECNLSGMAIHNCKLDGMTVNGEDVAELLKRNTGK